MRDSSSNLAGPFRDVTAIEPSRMTGTTKDLVAGSEIVFQPRGRKQLKGIPGEWTLFAAAA
jgi:hypothetical protein